MPDRVMIAGGGTGGHIFPAISIAEELKSRDASMQILFVGARGGMEMSLVPKAGFDIVGVWISGISRSLSVRNIFRNLMFPIKLIFSLLQAKSWIRKFRPDVVIGVGGYASGPVGRRAASAGIPLLICEQNAYPGITNKWLAPKADAVLLGNADAAKYFKHHNVIVTGNPVRRKLLEGNREAGLLAWKFDSSRPVVLSLGGSLGAGRLNEALESGLEQFRNAGIQIAWQCGKRYYEEIAGRVNMYPGLSLLPFIDNMGDAYAAADLIITRAGASTISELILLEKPAILIPSPNVAEDHQTKNAKSLAGRGAAIILPDAGAKEKLAAIVIELVTSNEKLTAMKKAVSSLEKHDAAKEIADQVMKLLILKKGKAASS